MGECMNMIGVLGGGGFVGSHFVGIAKDVKLLEVPYDNKTHYAVLDEDYGEFPSNIINFISTVDNYNVFEDPYLDIHTNNLLLIKLLETWRKSSNSKEGCFNFISSWFVFGNEYDLDWAHETDECHPRGFYSITKFAAEQLLRSYCETFGLKYRILRLANVLGKGDKKVSSKRNAFQYLINEMKDGREIKIYEGGNFYRNYIHVYDVCDAIRLVIEKGDLNTIYNIGNENFRFIDMLNYAAQKIGYDIKKFQYIDQKDFHKVVQAKSFKMSTEKLQKLEFVPKYTMEIMIDSLL